MCLPVSETITVWEIILVNPEETAFPPQKTYLFQTVCSSKPPVSHHRHIYLLENGKAEWITMACAQGWPTQLLAGWEVRGIIHAAPFLLTKHEKPFFAEITGTDWTLTTDRWERVSACGLCTHGSMDPIWFMTLGLRAKAQCMQQHPAVCGGLALYETFWLHNVMAMEYLCQHLED